MVSGVGWHKIEGMVDGQRAQWMRSVTLLSSILLDVEEDAVASRLCKCIPREERSNKAL